MQASTTWAAAVLIALAACGGGDAPTEVAIKNGGTTSIDATISDGKTELTFEGVAAGSTSSYRTVSFHELSGLTVEVGTQTSSVDLSGSMLNVVTIGEDGKVKGVVATQPAGGEGAW